MTIRPEALVETRHLVVQGRSTLLQAFSCLLSVSGDPDWQLIILKQDGTWAAARFDRLHDAVSNDPAKLDLPLEDLDLFTPVRAVDRSSMGTGESRRLARVSPCGLLVVTDGGNLVGVIHTAKPRIASVTLQEIDHLTGIPREIGHREERYTDIACPRQVWKATPRFSLVVRLTLRPTMPSVVNRMLEIQTGRSVRIHLEAPAFEILNAASQEIVAPSGLDSPPVVFDLRPRDSGHQCLVLDFFQDRNPLGTVLVSVEVVEQPAPDSQVRAPSCILAAESGVTPPDRVLRVAWHRELSSLNISLLEAGGSSWQEFPPLHMPCDPATLTARLFKDMTVLAEGSDPTADAVLGERRPLSESDVDRRLRLLGQQLWELLPEGLRSLYAQERERWHDTSLLIYSDETHIPWELVWPYGEEWEDSEPWCLTVRLTRWLRRGERGEGNRGAPGRLPLMALACLAPDDADLPAAQRERAFLQGVVRQRGIRDASPPEPTWEAVMDLLGSGGYDWLHVSAHGSFHAEAPNQHSALWLKGRAALTPQHLVGPGITSHLRRARPAFLFNACHAGRLGWSLTGVGGWAERLIGCGAGMFVGPLWVVDDDTALLVAQTLYEHLLQGETLSEAVRLARRNARRPGDPTWLAYSVYAHPNARVRLPD